MQATVDYSCHCCWFYVWTCLYFECDICAFVHAFCAYVFCIDHNFSIPYSLSIMFLHLNRKSIAIVYVISISTFWEDLLLILLRKGAPRRILHSCHCFCAIIVLQLTLVEELKVLLFSRWLPMPISTVIDSMWCHISDTLLHMLYSHLYY